MASEPGGVILLRTRNGSGVWGGGSIAEKTPEGIALRLLVYSCNHFLLLENSRTATRSGGIAVGNAQLPFHLSRVPWSGFPKAADCHGRVLLVQRPVAIMLPADNGYVRPLWM